MATKVDLFERLVFKLVRWFFLGMALLAFVLMLLSAFMLIKALPGVFGPDQPRKVEVAYEEVKPYKPTISSSGEAKITSEEEQSVNDSKSKAKQEKDFYDKSDPEIDKIINLYKSKLGYLFPLIYNEQRLREFIKDVISPYPDHIKKDFLTGLYNIINKAADDELKEVKILEKYVIKFNKKYEDLQKELYERKIKAKNQLMQSLVTIGSSILIIIFAGIFLLLSAIEKNIRSIKNKIDEVKISKDEIEKNNISREV